MQDHYASPPSENFAVEIDLLITVEDAEQAWWPSE